MNVLGLGLPIGTSAFKPSCAIRLIVLSYYVAFYYYHVGISVGWLIVAVLIAVILSIVVPAIPGGTLLFCPMLFAQLGLPVAALTSMLATEVLFDAVFTSFNQVSAQLALAQQADINNE